MSKKPNPKPTGAARCFACGHHDRRFGGPRRLEADHVAGEANNPDVMIWLCKPGCHDIATGLQYDLGVNLEEAKPRSEADRQAALLQGTAMRMALMDARHGRTESAAVFLDLAAGVGDILHDRPQFDPDVGIRSVGPNPLQNDVRHRRFDREDADKPLPENEEPIPPSAATVLELLREMDSELPGKPFLTGLNVESVGDALTIAEERGLLDRLASVASRVAEIQPLLFRGLGDSRRTDYEEIDPKVVEAGLAVVGVIGATMELFTSLSDRELTADEMAGAFDVFYARCDEHLQSTA